MDLTEKSSDILKLSCLDLGHSYTQFQGEKKKLPYYFQLYYTHWCTHQEYNRLIYKNAIYVMTQLGLSEQGRVV